MSEQTWTVVQFEEDNTVEAVPSTWIQGQFCHWPTYSREKLMSAIKKHESINRCWPNYKIRNFRNSTFNDYSKARSKARTAESTSDLNTEVEDGSKRTRIQKILSSSSSTEENFDTSSIPQPPKLKRKTKILEQEKYIENSKSKHISPKKTTSYNIENNNVLTDDVIFNKDVAWTSSTSCDASLFSASCNSTCTCCTKKLDEKTVKNLVTQNYLIRSVVTDILCEVKDVKLQLKNMSQQTNINREREQISSIFNNDDLNFPLQTEEQLQTVERILENDTEITNAINELQHLGGKSEHEFIRRALSRMITNEIGDKYSFFGRKQKKAFCNLNICKMLISASKKGGYCETTKDAEKFIQGWLRRAAEREKLRQQ